MRYIQPKDPKNQKPKTLVRSIFDYDPIDDTSTYVDDINTNDVDRDENYGDSDGMEPSYE